MTGTHRWADRPEGRQEERTNGPQIALTDALFLVCHDEYTGRPLLAEPTLSLGLAAGLVAELVLGNHLSVDNGHLHVARYDTPQDPLQAWLWDLIRRESRRYSLHDWLNFVAIDARERIGARLVASGVVYLSHERRMFRRGDVVFPAADPNWAAWQGGGRLRVLLAHGIPISWPDLMLTALIVAAGLDQYVLAWAPELFDVPAITKALPPPLRELAGHTRAAIGAAAQVGR